MKGRSILVDRPEWTNRVSFPRWLDSISIFHAHRQQLFCVWFLRWYFSRWIDARMLTWFGRYDALDRRLVAPRWDSESVQREIHGWLRLDSDLWNRTAMAATNKWHPNQHPIGSGIKIVFHLCMWSSKETVGFLPWIHWWSHGNDLVDCGKWCHSVAEPFRWSSKCSASAKKWWFSHLHLSHTMWRWSRWFPRFCLTNRCDCCLSADSRSTNWKIESFQHETDLFFLLLGLRLRIFTFPPAALVDKSHISCRSSSAWSSGGSTPCTHDGHIPSPHTANNDKH